MSNSAFFYGTLMHPDILRRVINHIGPSLQICPAELLDYTRHQVKFADYPGILPYSRSRIFFDHALGREERSVRGTLVTGLSNADIELLDNFEGDEYVRQIVEVRPLGEFTSLAASPIFDQLSSSASTGTTRLLSTSELSPVIQAQTYVYSASITHLKPDLWSFDEFVKTNAWKWIGEPTAARFNGFGGTSL